MHWVIVNYSKADKQETFYVNEEEEKHRKSKSKLKKYIFPVFNFMFSVSKYL